MEDGKLHHRTPNLCGRKFGALTGVRAGKSDGKKRWWIWRCDCGATCEKVGTEVRKAHRRGQTPNCGCLTLGIQRDNQTSHGMSQSPAYAVWRSMKARCSNPTHGAWKNYGGRGIRVCDEWLRSFEAFWRDMGPTYRPGFELDRRDNNAGYNAANCRWVMRVTNSNNRRTSKMVKTPDGTMSVAEASRLYGIGKSTIHYRIKMGWPEDQILRSTT